ncbi:MAG: hypothetical protein ISS87_01465 [Candidatus Pacebacteria bacterium]|nr:hypothetical protein [Candidatus Paceibacterota bacterium]
MGAILMITGGAIIGGVLAKIADMHFLVGSAGGALLALGMIRLVEWIKRS